MQRREAKSGGKDRKCHRRPNERNDTGENPHRNGLSRVGAGICGFVGLDGGVRSHVRTGLSPDKCPFAGYFCELLPVVGKCAEIRCVNSMAYKRIP